MSRCPTSTSSGHRNVTFQEETTATIKEINKKSDSIGTNSEISLVSAVTIE
ncbi:hypothetical protein AVEN_11069-1, partial [Araneus ventricosus]